MLEPERMALPALGYHTLRQRWRVWVARVVVQGDGPKVIQPLSSSLPLQLQSLSCFCADPIKSTNEDLNRQVWYFSPRVPR